jgi:hypothetical protein
VSGPLCTLELVRGGRTATGTVDLQAARIDVPGQEIVVPPDFVPEALARLNDVGPRPRAEGSGRLRVSVAGLATALATRDAAAAELSGPDADALRGVLAALREHWRVEARWTPAEESPGVRVVEVLDTDAGMWLVVPDGDHVELWPSTPTMVFRSLCALLPRDAELARV